MKIIYLTLSKKIIYSGEGRWKCSKEENLHYDSDSNLIRHFSVYCLCNLSIS